MYTVTSQLMLKVHKEDDGVPVICQVEHPAVTGNLQTQRYLEVQCEYLSSSVQAALTKQHQAAYGQQSFMTPFWRRERPRTRRTSTAVF